MCACVCVRRRERESERPQRETTMFSQPPRASNHDNRMAGRHGSSSIEAGVFLFLQNSALVAFQDRLVLLKKGEETLFSASSRGTQTHRHAHTSVKSHGPHGAYLTACISSSNTALLKLAGARRLAAPREHFCSHISKKNRKAKDSLSEKCPSR